ncbi:MAG: NAD(P)H-hydrate dehydratase [Chloroflexi bacterium]|nr:NAD(P)H-hydrate dehydratase [Chloroflexota bacterium]
MKIVTAEEMRETESRAATIGLTSPILMENAGLTVAQKIQEWVGDLAGKRILVLVGPGNNGGDGLVAARHLHDWGARVFLYLYHRHTEADDNLQQVLNRGLLFRHAKEDADFSCLKDWLSNTDLVVDALLGTGKARPIGGDLAELLHTVQGDRSRLDLRLVAIDLPTGLNPDTGAVDPATIAADLTITLGYPKMGFFTSPGADYLGKLQIGDIGIPESFAQDTATELVTNEWVKNHLPARPRNAYKGTFGHVLIIAGSRNYVGAAYLAAAAVMRVGAGLATLALAQSLHPILAAKLTETTFLPLPEAEAGIIGETARETILSQLPNYDVVLLGCGLGQHPSTAKLIQEILPSLSLPVVIDADGLNALASIPRWWQNLPAPTILTPHPGEMARLTGHPTSEVEAGRIDIARRSALKWGRIVVLKGAYTAIANPDGYVKINPVANPALATAGTGDVLAGAIAGLLAQGLSPFDAAACGSYLHGLAGEMLAEELGDAGVVAGDLLTCLPKAIKRIKGSE